MFDKIDTVMEQVAELLSDLESPAQNPAYGGPTKEEIMNVLRNVLSLHGYLEDLYNKSQEHEEHEDDVDKTFEIVEEKIEYAIRYLEHALDDIRDR